MVRPSPDCVRAQYEQIAKDYDKRYDGWRHRKRAQIVDAPQLALARGADRVLEVGCGTGRLLAQTGARVRMGVDLSTAMLERAKQRGLATICADAHRLPFASGSFDVVLAGKGVFRYLEPCQAFVECARVLSLGGGLAMHQYAARTWMLRDVIRQPRLESMHISDLEEIIEPASAAGLACQTIHLFRSIRFYPYALRIPRHLPGKFWGQCTIVFRRIV